MGAKLALGDSLKLAWSQSGFCEEAIKRKKRSKKVFVFGKEVGSYFGF